MVYQNMFNAGTSLNLPVFEKGIHQDLDFSNFIEHGIILTGNVQFWKLKIPVLAKCA